MGNHKENEDRAPQILGFVVPPKKSRKAIDAPAGIPLSTTRRTVVGRSTRANGFFTTRSTS
jgi:hypothetical protein